MAMSRPFIHGWQFRRKELPYLPASVTLPIVVDGVTRRDILAGAAGGVIPLVQTCGSGDRFVPGQTNGTFFDVNAFRAQPSSNGKATLVGFGEYYFETHCAPYIDDNRDFIKADDTALSTGAWVRQGADKIRVSDGGNVQDAVMVAANPIDLLASRRAFSVGSSIRTANGFIYKVASVSATDAHVVTAGGVRLYIAGVITPDALGAPCDGVGDDAPFFERAYEISPTLNLIPTSTYRLASLIGLPDVVVSEQGISASDAVRLFCNGATILCRSPVVNGAPEAIWTSASAKLDPETTADAYAAKMYVQDGNWRSESNWAEPTGSVIFNGDRLYQIVLENNSFHEINCVVKSFRRKQGSGYEEGYIQSLAIVNNQFSLVQRIVDAKRAFNVVVTGNFASACLGGFYIDGTRSDVAVSFMTFRDNLFQGGGCVLVLGPVLALDFSGGYLESNTQGDTGTQKCEIWLKAGKGTSSGVTIKGVGFQPHPDQINDPEYATVRIDYEPIYPISPAPRIEGCWTTGGNMATPGKAILVNCGAIREAAIRNTLSPFDPQSARRSTINGSQNFTDNDHLRGGVYRVATIDTKTVLSSLPFQNQRPAAGEISILMRHQTSGGVTVGATLAVVGFVMMASSEGVSTAHALNDAYISFFLKWCVPVEAGNAIDKLGATTHEHFASPSLSVERIDNLHHLSLSGYSARSIPNYGPADRISSHITMQSDGLNGSSVMGSPIAIA